MPREKPQQQLFVLQNRPPQARSRRAAKRQETLQEQADRRIYLTDLEAYLANLRLDYLGELTSRGSSGILFHHRERTRKLAAFEGDPIVSELTFGYEVSLDMNSHRIIEGFVNRVMRQ